ncbi:Serpin family [Trema orientale]|uniref:Serpin family n=1 Tax=Trema orientale TaxID=63057 RepID=A0A2P5F6W0_TREOI|nr:Serpin family [Trema orientale]
MLSFVAAGSKGIQFCGLSFVITCYVKLGCCRVKGPYLGTTIVLSEIIRVASPDEGSGNHLNCGPQLKFVNGAWLDQRFMLKPSFETTIKDSYKTNLKNVDFPNKANEVVEEVSTWAEKATQGLVKELLPSGSLDSDTTLVLANALYFKGSWVRKFDASKTQPKNFYLLNGRVIHVPFMTTERITEEHEYECFQDFMDSSNLSKCSKTKPEMLNQQLDVERAKLPEFWIPKFKFSSEFEASHTMKEMGLTLPFQTGDLTEAVDHCSHNDQLYVSDMSHESFIEVNEEGPEATASSGIMWQLASEKNRLSSKLCG